MDNDLNKSNIKIGLWTEYYTDGQIKSQGNYKINSYLKCCVSCPCRHFYNYKIGVWKYFYQNGQVKMTGNYRTKKEHIRKGCIKGEKIFNSHIKKSWVYYNDKGEKIKLTNEIVYELNNANH